MEMGIAPQDITAVIAAGGASVRFGRDKATFVVGDETLLDRTVGIAYKLASTVLISLPKKESGEPQDWKGIRSRMKVVDDHVSAQGPAAALLAGLRAAETPWLLMLPTDLPFMTASALKGLLEGEDEVARVAVDRSGRLHPAVCLVPVLQFDTLLSLAASGESALHRLLAAINTRDVETEERALHNMNRPQDAP